MAVAASPSEGSGRRSESGGEESTAVRRRRSGGVDDPGACADDVIRWGRCGRLLGLCCLAMALGVRVLPPAQKHTVSSTRGGLVVSVSPSTVAPGQTLQVSGFHFPARNRRHRPDMRQQRPVGIGRLCTRQHGLGTVVPPGPVQHVDHRGYPSGPLSLRRRGYVDTSSTVLSRSPSSPVTIVGASVGPLRTPASAVTVNQPLHILNAQLSGNGPWYSWFGGMAHRTFTLTVHNPNVGVYPHPSLVLGGGKVGDASPRSRRLHCHRWRRVRP